MSSSGIRTAPALKSPYPGLRPFEAEESDLFFGREPQIDELLRRLGRSRFVAVLGSSGSGKSSLVRAGLVPALVGGLLTGAGSHWRIAVFRPGGDPIGGLTDALSSTLYSAAAEEASRRDLIEITLRRSSLGLVEAVRQAYLPKYENLLIVVDQFEELFRFHQTRRSPEALDQAAGLVRLLLEANRQSEIPIHVLITMRSDFLGDCSQFRDLPETINEGLYLIPRMTRDQFRQAITGPAAVSGGTVTPRLVQQLLNDLSNDPDQLPVLQHALMRAWNNSRNRPGDSTLLDHQDYLATGGMAEALSRHADEVWEELEAPDRQIAEQLFQCLTEKGPDNREIRRPTRLGQICRILEADRKSVTRVIERFREEDRAFLMPSRLIPLDENSVIDISHESLIRKWDRLRGWVAKEAQARGIYERLADAARLNRRSEAGLFRNPELQLTLDWKEQERPNEAWAERYEPDFALAVDFLDRSVADLRAEEIRAAEILRSQARAARMEKTGKRVIAALAAALIVIGLFGWQLVKTQKLLQETRASRLATKAAFLQIKNDAAVDESLLLALESMRSNPLLLESAEIARNSLALLPKQVLRKEYGDEIQVVAFSPDGEYVASVGAEGTPRVMEVATGREVSLPKGVEHVAAIAFGPNPDTRRLASGGDDRTARVMEADKKTGEWKQIARFDHDGGVIAVAFSPDGRYLATASSDQTARVMDTATGKEVARFMHSATRSDGTGAATVAFSPDGHHVATGSWDRTVRAMKVATRQQIWQVTHGGIVNSVVFSHNGRFVATASSDRTARLLDAANGREIFQLLHEDAVTAVAFSPDDRYVATASVDSSARIMDAATGKEVARLKHQDRVNAVAFYPDGRYIATASVDHTSRVLELATGREVSRMPHKGEVRAVAVDRNGRYLATGGADGSVRILAETTGNAIFRDLDTGTIRVAAIASGGRYLAIAGSPTDDGRNGSIRLFDLQNKAQAQAIVIPTQLEVNDAAFSADGRFLAWGGKGQTARILEIGTHKVVDRKFPQHDAIYGIALSPKGRYLATGGDYESDTEGGNRTARVVELATGREVIVNHKDRVVAVSFSPDEGFLATGSVDKTTAVVNLTTEKELSRYTHQDQVNAVAFSPDARYIVTGGADGWLRVMEAASGREVSRTLHPNRINAVAFSLDGKYVAAANQDATALVVEAATGRPVSIIRHPDPVMALRFVSGDVNALQTFAGHALYQHPLGTEDLRKQACSQLSRNLTSNEWNQHIPEDSYRKTCPGLP